MKFREMGLAFAFSVIGACAAAETLTLASPAPGPAPINQAFQQWADRVAAASGGAVTVNVVAGGTLGRHGQVLDRVTQGVVDISWDFHGYYPGRFPRSSVAELPAMFHSSLAGSRALQTLYEDGHLDGEYDDLVLLGMFAFPNNSVLLTRPLPEGGDLSGLRMSAQNPTMYAAAEMLGAVPVAMNIADWYPAMSRGTIDGAIVAMTAVPAFRFHEVASHFYKFPLGGNTALMFMNRDRFEELPQAMQAAILSVSGMGLSDHMGAFLDDQATRGEALAATRAQAIVTLDEAQVAAWTARLVPLRDAWLATGNGDQALIDAMAAAVAAAQ